MSLLEGLFAAAVTPRQPNSYEANLAASLEVVDFLCGFPLDGLVILGTTGEMIHFDVPERLKILEFAMKRSTLPVIAGVTHSTLEGTVELAQHALLIGCAAILVMPPYYFRYRSAEIRTFYHELARRVGVKKPILAYNIPAFTSLIPTDTALAMVEEGVIHGVKDSSGNRESLEAFLEARTRLGFQFMVGDDKLFWEARRHAGVGSISGIASAIPELFIGLTRALRTDRDDSARQFDTWVQEFCSWYDEFPNCMAVKDALALRTRLTIPPATPLSFERQQKLEQFREWFAGWLPNVQALYKEVMAVGAEEKSGAK